MSYTPTTWETGDTITAEKLNNMESGISNSEGLVVNAVTDSEDTITMDKTFREIADAFYSGRPIVVNNIDDPPQENYSFWCVVIGVEEDTSRDTPYYAIKCSQTEGKYITHNENSYPVWEDS